MIKVKDIAYVRFAAPDLVEMERFLTDFGFAVAAGPGDVLYARGTDPSPYLHVTEPGEAGLRAIAFEAASPEDLTLAAQLEGASSIEKIDAMGQPFICALPEAGYNPRGEFHFLFSVMY